MKKILLPIAALLFAVPAFAQQGSVPSAPFNPVNSNNAVQNWDILKVPKIAKCLGLVRSNLGVCNFAFVGDSRTAGVVGSTPGSSNTTSSFPYYIYKELLAEGIPARYDFFEIGTTSVAGSGDSRVTIGSGWTAFGNYLFNNPGNLTSALSFAPTDTVTTCVIQVYKSATGTVRYNWDGGSNTDTAITGTNTYTTITASVASGVHVLNVYADAGLIGYVDCSDSSVNDVRIKNYGSPGVSANGANSASATAQKNAWAAITADAFFMDLGTNDYGLNNASQFQTNISGIATALTAGGANLVLEIPSHIPGATEALQNSYDAGILAVAGTTYPIFNMLTRYGLTYAQMNANGWQNDALHPYQATYADQGGAWIAKAFTGKF